MALSDEILADLKAKKGGGGRPGEMKGAPPMADDEPSEGEDSYAGDEESAASDIMDAMEARDPVAFAAGLKGFMEICFPKIHDGMKGGDE